MKENKPGLDKLYEKIGKKHPEYSKEDYQFPSYKYLQRKKKTIYLWLFFGVCVYGIYHIHDIILWTVNYDSVGYQKGKAKDKFPVYNNVAIHPCGFGNVATATTTFIGDCED